MNLPAIDADRLREGVSRAWDVRAVMPETASTNDDAAALVASRRSGGTDWPAVLIVADHQTAGRGRRDRRWSAPARTSVAISILRTPRAAMTTWGWLPLLAGQAVREAAAELLRATGRSGDALIKWPNDVLVEGEGGGKLSGVLTEVRGSAVVVGAGINTNLDPMEHSMPEGATSLRRVSGALVDPTDVVLRYLAAFEQWSQRWDEHAGDGEACGLRAAHLESSATVGRLVDVHTPAGPVHGQAIDIDLSGQLVVDVAGRGPVSLSAGDVVHVRPGGS